MDVMDRMNAVRAGARSRVVLKEDENGNLVNQDGSPVQLDTEDNLVAMPPVAKPIVPVVPVVEIPTPVPTPETVPVPQPVVPPTPMEFTAVEEWQATDVNGKSVGPPSKIIGRGVTEVAALKDLAAKLRELNITAARKIKEYRDKYRAYDEEKAVMTFGDPEPLTPETKVQIARLLADPATVDAGFELLYKAQFGESPAQVRERRARQAEAEQIKIGQAETQKFLAEHPDFPLGDSAKRIVIGEMEARKEQAISQGRTFGFTAHNLEIVYDDLVEKGLIVPRQMAEKAAEPVPTPTPTTSGNSGATAESQITPAPASQGNTPPSASPASTPVGDANTSPASSTRPRGTRFSVLSTEHGQQAPVNARQMDEDAFRKMVDELPLETLKRRIKSDRAFAKRLNEIKWQ